MSYARRVLMLGAAEAVGLDQLFSDDAQFPVPATTGVTRWPYMQAHRCSILGDRLTPVSHLVEKGIS